MHFCFWQILYCKSRLPDPSRCSDTKTSLVPAEAGCNAGTYVDRDTAGHRAPIISHSPVWSPAPDFNVRSALIVLRNGAAARNSQHRCAGPSNVARNPSPVVLTSRPRKRAKIATDRGVMIIHSRSRQRWSPSAAAFSVEPTISVKRTLSAKTRDRWRPVHRDPVKNSSMASAISSALLPT